MAHTAGEEAATKAPQSLLDDDMRRGIAMARAIELGHDEVRDRLEYKVMAYIVMACTVTAYIVMACIVMAYIGMAHIVMAFIVMAYIVMAHIVMPT